MSEIFFLMLEEIFHIPQWPCNVLFIIILLYNVCTTLAELLMLGRCFIKHCLNTGNPGSLIVPQLLLSLILQCE